MVHGRGAGGGHGLVQTIVVKGRNRGNEGG